LTVCDPPRLSEKVTELVCNPAVVGANVKPIKQLPPCGKTTLPWVQVVTFAPLATKPNAVPAVFNAGLPPDHEIVVEVLPALAR